MAAQSTTTPATGVPLFGGYGGPQILNNTGEQSEVEEEEELIPPENLSMVCKGVYRSAFPKKKNFAFLKRLGLKSVL